MHSRRDEDVTTLQHQELRHFAPAVHWPVASVVAPPVHVMPTQPVPGPAVAAFQDRQQRPMLVPQPRRRDHVVGLVGALTVLAVLLSAAVAFERGTVPKPRSAAAASMASAPATSPEVATAP